MFPISIYTGGAVENGAMGATYNKPPSVSYPAQDDITFDELKRAIFQVTGIDEGKYVINVNARWNAGLGGSFCFVLLPICENSMWRMVVDKALSGSSIVELFVETVPKSGPTQNNDPREKSHQSAVEFGEITTPEPPVGIGTGEEGDSQDLTDDEESIDVKPRDEWDLYERRLFDSLDDLKHAIIEYHLRQNRKFVTAVSCRDRYVVKCEAYWKCGWRLYAKGDKNGNYFQIKKIKGVHVCSNEGERGDHPNMTGEFVARVILNLMKKKGGASPREIQEFVQERYACKPSYGKAWRAKELAKARLFGEWKESNTKLAPFFNAIQVANPGTKVEWWSDSTADPNVRPFRGVAWAFAPAIEGFKHCLPVIGIDSTLVCSKYGGTMLLAVAYDGEGQVLPLAFAVTKVEDDESWTWFMRWLRAEVVGPRPLCVISDRKDSISRLFDQPDSGWCTGTGHAFHRYCSRYLCQIFSSAFKNFDLVKLVKWVSSQNQPSKFRLGMLRILETDQEAYNWLVKVGTKPNEESAYHLWSLCEDGGRRYGIMAVNGNESVFSIFPHIEELPITALVELTFAKSAELFTTKRETASKIDAANQLWSNKVTTILEARRAKATQHRIVNFQSQSVRHDEVGVEVEVETRNKVKHTVRLGHNERSCSCQKPQLTGIPCSHLLAVCEFRSFPGDHFVDAQYSARQLLVTWAPQFRPAGSPDEWPDYAGVAYELDRRSNVKEGGGKRRRRKRVRKDSGPFKYRCSLCREIGHTKNHCSRFQGTRAISVAAFCTGLAL